MSEDATSVSWQGSTSIFVHASHHSYNPIQREMGGGAVPHVMVLFSRDLGLFMAEGGGEENLSEGKSDFLLFPPSPLLDLECSLPSLFPSFPLLCQTERAQRRCMTKIRLQASSHD